MAKNKEQKVVEITEQEIKNQEEMANILHVKRGRYSLWELGINIIPLKNLCDYADYFNYSIDYVLGLTPSKESPKVLGIDFQTLGKNMQEIRLKNNLSVPFFKSLTFLNVLYPSPSKSNKQTILLSISREIFMQFNTLYNPPVE